MKIRTGFVSNSSSSSFVCLYKKDEVDKLMHTLTGTERLVFDEVFGETEVFGQHCYLYDDYSDRSGECYRFDYLNLPEEVEDVWEVLEVIRNKLNGVTCWSHSQDW